MLKIANNRLIYNISAYIYKNKPNEHIRDIHITHFWVSRKYITVDFVYKNKYGDTYFLYDLKLELDKVIGA